jgi:hypothetical protein
MAATTLRARRRAALAPRASSTSWAPITAATLSLLAGWVHLAYAQSHWRQWWAYGLFFAGTGAVQALFAIAIMRRPRPGAAVAGIVANLGIVAMYVLSRTDGPPLGPHAGVTERAGTIDLATTAGEIVLVAVLLTLAGRGGRRAIVNVLAVAGLLLWALRLTGKLP